MRSPADWRGMGTAFHHRGYRIFVAEGGDAARHLLCLHGFPTSSWDWAAVWPHLTARFHVLAPDFLGFGFSAKPARHPYSMLDQADLVEGLVTSRGLGAVDVLAHDIGDTVTQELLARQREGQLSFRIRTVTLLNGGLFPETHRPVLVQRLLLGPAGPLVSRLINERAFSRNMRKLLVAEGAQDPQILRQLWAIASSDGGTRITHRLIGYIHERELHRRRWVDALTRPSVPVRLIVGLDDPVSGAHMVDRYRELVANADVVPLPGIGHYPQLEAPQAMVDAFLSVATGHPTDGDPPDTDGGH